MLDTLSNFSLFFRSQTKSAERRHKLDDVKKKFHKKFKTFFSLISRCNKKVLIRYIDILLKLKKFYCQVGDKFNYRMEAVEEEEENYI